MNYHRLFDPEREEIEVSDKHVPLRIAAFALAFIVAVGAFAMAVTGIAHKDPGYYSINADPNDAAPRYVNSAALRYYCDGESNSIKAVLRAIQPVYNAALLESFELLDCEEEYVGVINLATLNANPGQDIRLDPRLYDALLDAYDRTLEQEGYSVFAGPLYKEWTTLLYLEDATDFDALNDPDEAARLETLADLAQDLSLCTLTVVDAESRTVRFDVDEKVTATLAALELDAPVLDLNILRDAYQLEMTAAALVEQGFDSGYLSADSGVSLALPGLKRGEFRLYGLTEEGTSPAGAMAADGGTAASLFHVFAYDDTRAGFYTVEGPEGTVYRHPYVPASGVTGDKLRSSLVLDPAGSAVEAVYTNLRLNGFETLRETKNFAVSCALPIAYTTPGGGKTVYANPAAKDYAAAETDYGYVLEAIT